MGGKPDAPPAPPEVKYPGMSKAEKRLLGKQNKIANQLLKQSKTIFGDSQADRGTALGIYDVLKQPPQLSETEMGLVNQLGDSYLNLYQKGITEGANKEVFDKNLRGTLANLSSRGILDSSIGGGAIGDLYKEQTRQLAQAADQAGLQKLNLQNDMLNKQVAKNMDLFSSFYTGAGNSGQLANQLAQSSGGIFGNVGQQYQQDRTNAFNIQTQNQQAQYMYQQQQYNQAMQRSKQQGGLFGSLGGAGLGALAGLALAPFTGGASILGASLSAGALNGLVGAGVGGMLGGSLGSSFF